MGYGRLKKIAMVVKIGSFGLGVLGSWGKGPANNDLMNPAHYEVRSIKGSYLRGIVGGGGGGARLLEPIFKATRWVVL